MEATNKKKKAPEAAVAKKYKVKEKLREVWLDKATALLKKKYFTGDHKLPKKVQSSCGFPKGTNRAIGQCFDPSSSADKTTHIFISPVLEDSIQVLGVHLHELIHAAVGTDQKHSGNFKVVARQVGLVGKLTATYVQSDSPLHLELAAIHKTLGNYPHKKMKKSAKKTSGQPWMRLVSQSDDTYKINIKVSVFEEAGAPVDPWGDEMIPLT